MVKKIVNKIVETIPRLVGRATDLFGALLKQKGKNQEADRRPAVRPRPVNPTRQSSGESKTPASSKAASPAKAATSKSSAASAKPSAKAAKSAASKPAPVAKKAEAPSAVESAPKSAKKQPAVPSLSELEGMTRKELYGVAQDLDITGRKSMRKAELLEAIKEEKQA